MALRGQPDRRFSRKRLGRAPQGRVIVNLASTAGLVGSTQDPLYSMTKGGVTLFTISAALEFAYKGYRVRVNSIHRHDRHRHGRSGAGHLGAQRRHQRHRGGAPPGHRAGCRPAGWHRGVSLRALGVTPPSSHSLSTRRTAQGGTGSTGSRTSGCQSLASFTRGQTSALPSNIRGGSRMRECRTSGSVRGVPSNGHPYRNLLIVGSITSKLPWLSCARGYLDA